MRHCQEWKEPKWQRTEHLNDSSVTVPPFYMLPSLVRLLATGAKLNRQLQKPILKPVSPFCAASWRLAVPAGKKQSLSVSAPLVASPKTTNGNLIIQNQRCPAHKN